MERSEPTLVPQWLRSSGSSNGGGTTIHPLASSSSLHSDDRVAPKLGRNRSVVNKNDNSLGRPSVLEHTTSSYFRRSSSSSNGSVNLRASSSFGRNSRDKDVYELRNRDNPVLGSHRHWDQSDPFESLSPRVGKEGLKRSQSRGEIWSRKVMTGSNSADKNHNVDGTGLLAKDSSQEAASGKDFASHAGKLATSEIGRVPSPGLSSAIQSLPVAASAIVGLDKWKSALAEVPSVIESNGTSISSGKAAAVTSPSPVSLSKYAGLNMAETVVQGPSRTQTPPQLSTETQRLEELAIKQSRLLVPMTPSMPKALVPNTSDKLKAKVGQQQQSISSNLASHSPRGGPVKPDVSRTSSVGKLQVLKPTWERNGVSPTAKDSVSPANGSKVANSGLASSQLVAEPYTLKSPRHVSDHPTERKPIIMPLVEKRPTSQAQSRNEFFNLMRKKSIANSSVPDVAPAEPSSALNKPNEIGDVTFPASTDNGNGELKLESKGDRLNDGTSCLGQEHVDSGKSNSSFDSNFFSEEEEAAFLRSLGWEENAEEDGLTEEEINAFYRDVTKYIQSKPSWKILQGTQPRFLTPLGNVPAIASGLDSSGSKMES